MAKVLRPPRQRISAAERLREENAGLREALATRDRTIHELVNQISAKHTEIEALREEVARLRAGQVARVAFTDHITRKEG